MSNAAPTAAGPLDDQTLALVRELVREHGVLGASARLGLSRNAIAQASAGGVVHRATAIAIAVGLERLQAPQCAAPTAAAGGAAR